MRAVVLKDARVSGLDLGVAATLGACTPFRSARTSVVLDASGQAYVAYRRSDGAHPGLYDIAVAVFRPDPAPTVTTTEGLNDWSASTGAALLSIDQAEQVHLIYGTSAGLKYARVAPEPSPTRLIPGVVGTMTEPIDFIAEGK